MKDKSNKKYYICDLNSAIVPLKDYKFKKSESKLKLLVDNECFLRNSEYKSKKIIIDKMLNEIGFEWDPLSKYGHMRQISYAVTIMEAIEKYSWLSVKEFCEVQNIPLYKVNGGELFDSNISEIKNQISLISNNSELYGSNLFNVVFDNKKLVLRYNACMTKLSIAKGFNLSNKDLPIGLFEISKSYRYEKEKELQLCKRVMSFLLPEIDIINDCLKTSIKMALIAHISVLNKIKELDSEYELLCNVTQDFLDNNLDFLKAIVKSIGKPILLAVYNDVCCKDGVKIDIEYKIFDSLKSPVEIATVLVDDGGSEFSLNLKYKSKNGIKNPVSILHVVFPFGSIERFAYFLIDRAIKKKTKTGFYQLPFWVSPIQIRVIPFDKNSFKDAKKLVKKLDLSNFRVDCDDRNISYSSKIKEKDIKWIPYIITVNKNFNIEKNDLIKEIKTEDNKKIIVPRYSPMFLSKRKIYKNKWRGSQAVRQELAKLYT